MFKPPVTAKVDFSVAEPKTLRRRRRIPEARLTQVRSLGLEDILDPEPKEVGQLEGQR